MIQFLLLLKINKLNDINSNVAVHCRKIKQKAEKKTKNEKPPPGYRKKSVIFSNSAFDFLKLPLIILSLYQIKNSKGEKRGYHVAFLSSGVSSSIVSDGGRTVPLCLEPTA
ncbi:MAG: hypothetical protein J6Q65_02400 [Lentisphaeria bacterium]|nr:hypothetical protein [Lentisphaeria bacterium]